VANRHPIEPSQDERSMTGVAPACAPGAGEPAWEAALPPLRDPALAARVQARLDKLTKPLGSLGRLEELALQVAQVQGHAHPAWQDPQVLVFAADHGLAAHGVSAYPSAVTAQMVSNFLAGGAAISVLARLWGLDLTVVDMGVAAALPAHPRLRRHPVSAGTADACSGWAMTHAQGEQAITAGADVVRSLPGNLVVLGEMGIGNSSSAALLTAHFTGAPLHDCIGAGTGLAGPGLQRKREVLTQVWSRHSGLRAPLDALCAFGGFELAAMVGAMLAAAAQRRVVLVDGYIATAAALVTHALQPQALAACVFAHEGAEPGHGLALRALDARALLSLDLRLGEGSGAALAWPLLQASLALLDGMASFEQAGVSTAASSGPAVSRGRRRAKGGTGHGGAPDAQA